MIKIIKNRWEFLDDIKDNCAKCPLGFNGDCTQSCGKVPDKIYNDQKIDNRKNI